MLNRQPTVFVNALPPDAQSFIALAVVVCHRRTDEEKVIDLLLENDRIGTVLAAINAHMGASWAFVESKVIDSPDIHPMAIAA